MILKQHSPREGTGLQQSGENQTFLNKITYHDIGYIFDQLEQTEPFKIADIEVDDEKKGRVRVEISTI